MNARQATGHATCVPVSPPRFTALRTHVSKLLVAVCAIINASSVNRTGAGALDRLKNQPVFGGTAPNGRCLICDDVVTFGASLANLRGFLISAGAEVAVASAIGAAYGSTKLAPEPAFIDNLRGHYAGELETQTAALGFDCQCLTAREAYFLAGLRTPERFRNCFAQEIGEPDRARSIGCRI